MIEAQESITGTISSPTAINSVINNGVVIPTETDPTVPAHVKAITEEQIANWENGSNIDLSNYYTKADVDQKGYITEEQVDNKGFITSVPEETDPTVPEYVKNITEEQISNWDKGGNTDLTNYYTKDEVDNKGYTTEEDIATYVEANKESLRGPQGPKGDKGDKADTPEFEKEINGPTLTINDGKKVKVFEIEGNSYQETTSGKSLVDFSNYSQKGQYTSVNFENDILTLSCSKGSYQTYNIDITDLCKNNLGKQLAYNYKNISKSNSETPTAVQVVTYYNDGTATKYNGVVSSTNARNTFNIPSDFSNITKILLSHQINNSSTSYQNVLTIEEPMLYLGTATETPEYEPYTNGPSPNPDYPQEIEVIEGSVDVEVVGKNLFDINSCLIGQVVSSTGTITTATNWNTSNLIEVSSNQTYSISFTSTSLSNILIGEYDENEGFTQRKQINNLTTGTTYTTSSTAKYIRLSYRNDVGIENIQIEDDSATEYEPYKSTTATIDLQDNFLAKIGDVKDELDVVTGKLTKRIGKVVLDGSESTISKHSYGTNSFQIELLDMKYGDATKKMISNSFLGVPYDDRTNYTTPILYDDHTSSKYMIFRNTSFTTLEEFKTWLASNNVTIYYVLAEPYEVQLNPSTIPMEEGKVNNYSVTNSLVENLYCKYYTPYRGDDGVTPVKGVDYFTEADKQELINSIPSGGGGGNIATIEPEEGENYIYFFPNVVNKGLVDGTYFLTKTLKLATDSVSNTSGVSNNTTLFAFDTLVEIKEYIDANDSSIKSYDFIALNGNTFFITTENGVITEVMQSPLITKAYVDNLFDSIVNGNEVSY